MTDYNTISRYENAKSTPKLDALTKLAHVFNVTIETLRSEDLTQAGAIAARPGPGSALLVPRRAGESSLRPAKNPLLVSVELDGTPASLERAMARLVAINEVVAETD